MFLFTFAGCNDKIDFNHKNQWHFNKTGHKFAFAFTDLRFDQHGFPHQQPEN